MADQPERKKLSLNSNPTDSETENDPTGPLPRPDGPSDEQPKIEPPASPIETPEKDDSSIVDSQSAGNFETTRLKRVKPEEPETDPDTETTAPDDEKISNSTVHLKVIKEKKKQLAGILSASQTIRLRPAGGGEGDAPTEGGRKTLKIKAPTPGAAAAATPSQETKTDAIPKPQLTTNAPKPAAAVPARPPAIPSPPASGGRATLKIKAPTGTTPAVGAATPADSPAAAADSEKKETLKIKVPPPTNTGAAAAPAEPAADQQKPTLKIKPSVPTGTAPAAAPATTAEATPATTMEQPAQSPGRTLKLKTTPKTADTPVAPAATAPDAPPHSADAPQPEVPSSATATTPGTKASPGIIYTLATAASIAVVGVTVFLFFTHFSDMFGSPFGQ